MLNPNLSKGLYLTSSDGTTKKKMRNKEWEISRSSLAKIKKSPTYSECREYACKDICLHTQIEEHGFISEIPRGTRFNFLVRVGTKLSNPNDPSTYFGQFENRNYISFSTINNKNVSYYGLGGNILFAYNMYPELIAHIFPMDCDSDPHAINEDDITEFPSIWLTLHDLNMATLRLETYNQVTCKTKRNGEIIKPARIIVIDSINSEVEAVAKAFGIGCTIVHPNKNAICEKSDPFFSFGNELSSKR